jgi:hypothetical protein
LNLVTSQPAWSDSLRSRTSRLSDIQLLGLAVVAAMLIAAISLAFNHAIDYDPEGWIVYGRELLGPAALNTHGYPAWKPLPVLIIAPFTLISRGPADVYFWLFVTRTCGVLTLFGVAAIAHHYAGRWAALIAAVLLLLSVWWGVDSTLGRDGPVASAFVVGGVLAYQRAWYRATFLCCVLVSLLRPEAGPFVIVLGIWLWRKRRLTLIEFLAAVVVIALLWEVPVILHAGKSAANISTGGGVKGTPINSSDPFLTVIVDAAKQLRQLSAVLVAVAIASMVWGWVRPAGRGGWLGSLWGRSAEECVLLIGAICWVLLVAAETIHGYTGNPRYLISALSIFTVVVAVVAVRMVESWRPALIAMVVILLGGTLALSIHPLRSDRQLVAGRAYQVAAMHSEIAQLKCPGYMWADAANNAYLAVITGQSLQASLLPRHYPQRYVNGNYWFVYCAPPGWKPHGKA